MPRLHVNVDHVATLRQARRETFPDPLDWALAAEKAGADGITCHLRKDRRHIQDADVRRLRAAIRTRLTLEMCLEREIVAFACRVRPDAVCFVPEDRREITTEGGLDVIAERRRLAGAIRDLSGVGAEVSLFVDPDLRQIESAADQGAACIELHTGRYASALGSERRHELARLRAAAAFAADHGLCVHAGHGLDYENAAPVAALRPVEELSIGFAIVARALEVGVREAVHRMAVIAHRSAPVRRAGASR